MQSTRKALSTPETKKSLNRQLFDRIAGKYNYATRLLSLGQDLSWKNDLIKSLEIDSPQVCLDLACGTGDITTRLQSKFPDATIIGLDLSPEMIALAKERLSSKPSIQFEVGDICELPFEDSSVNLITGGYALRNVPDLQKALSEIHRVLQIGGVAHFLEFVQPVSPLRRNIHHGLLHFWGGLVGTVLHADPSVYRYIPESLGSYLDEHALQDLLQQSGFEVVRRKRHFFGIMERIELLKK